LVSESKSTKQIGRPSVLSWNLNLWKPGLVEKRRVRSCSVVSIPRLVTKRVGQADRDKEVRTEEVAGADDDDEEDMTVEEAASNAGVDTGLCLAGDATLGRPLPTPVPLLALNARVS
jgi:hypothetical protein